MKPVDPLPLVIVAAMGRNGAIGRANTLPWTMPTDLAHFRAFTMGKPMIMGRRTFQSIGRALPGRESIVVTGAPDFAAAKGIWRASGPDEALALARERARAMGADAITLIGGATLFQSMMAMTDRLDMTIVDMEPEADTFFPAIDAGLWREQSRVVAPRQAGDEAACSFVTFVRRR